MKDKLIIASFLSNLFYSACYPAVHSYLMQSVGQRMISINSLCTCLGGIILPFIWNKYSDILYKKYGKMLFLEAFCYICMLIMLINNKINLIIYYILDTICFTLITKNIICGGNRLRAIKYNNEEKRTKYDNNTQMAANISSLIGFLSCAIFEFNLWQAFLLSTIGICIDNIFYYLEWRDRKYEFKK